jgi:hypothetical protein
MKMTQSKGFPQNEAKSSKIMLKINNLWMHVITLTRIVSLIVEAMDQNNARHKTKQLPRKKKKRKKRRRDQAIDGGKKN